MADNALPSTDPNVATDDVAGVHFQRMKLVDGTAEGTDAIPGSAARGLMVDPRLKVVRKSVTPVISTTVYAAKDAVGGLLEFTDAVRSAGGSARLEAIQIVDKAQQRGDMDLVLFDRTITAPTDNAAFDPTDAELANVVGVVPLGGGHWYDFNDNAIGVVNNVGLSVVLNGTSLFGVLVARTTPTFVSTSDLVVTATLVQD